MADNSPSVELAPLKGSILLDLDQFDNAVSNVEDTLVHLAELFHIALNPNISIDMNDFDNSLENAIAKSKQLQEELSGLSDKDITIKANIEGLEDIHGIHEQLSPPNIENVSDEELKGLFDQEEIDAEVLNNILENTSKNFEDTIEEAQSQAEDLQQTLETIASKSEETWVSGLQEVEEQADSLLSKYDAAMIANDQYIASSIQAEFNGDIFKGDNEEEESDPDLDPANITGYGGGYTPFGGGSKRVESQEEGLLGTWDERGNKLLERGQMLQWTIAPYLVDVDKKALELGFTFQTALQMANREFGKNSAIVSQWSKTTVADLGLSSGTALNMADKFGLSARSMGANKTQAADLSEKLTSLADQITLATGGQIDLSTATSLLTSMLGGQTYGLEQLGISFSTTQQNAEALALGYHKQYKELTPLQKAYVNTQLLQKNLNGSLGSLNTNLGTAYGQWQKCKAQLAENSETMVMQLLPAITKIMHGITHLVSWFSHLGKGSHTVVAAFMLIATAVTPLLLLFGALIKSVTTIAKAFEKLFSVFKFFRRGAKDVEEVGKATEEAGKEAKGLFDIFKSVGRLILKIGETVIEWGSRIIEVVGEIIDAIDPVTAIITVIVVAVAAAAVEIYRHWDTVKKAIVDGLKDIKTKVTDFYNFIKGKLIAGLEDITRIGHEIASSVKKNVEHIGKEISDTAKKIWDDIKKVGMDIFTSIKDTVKHIYTILYNNPIIHAVGYVLFELRHLISTILTSIGDLIKAFLHFVWSWVDHYLHEIVDFVGRIAEELSEKVVTGLDSMLRHIEAFFSYCLSKVESFGHWVAAKVSNIMHDVSSHVEQGFEYVKGKFDSFVGWLGAKLAVPMHDVENTMEYIKVKIENGMRYVVSAFKAGWNDLCGWFSGTVDIPLHYIETLSSAFVEKVENFMERAKSSFETGWNDLCGWFSSEVEKPIHQLANTAEQWYSAGEHIIHRLLDGIKNAFVGVANWVGNAISHLASDITGFTHNAVGALNNASYHGSHATGLYNVPWDGYAAELHAGEMVLTKEQADQYRSGGGNGSINVTINSPQPLDPFEVKRQMEQYSRNMANGFY